MVAEDYNTPCRKSINLAKRIRKSLGEFVELTFDGFAIRINK